MPGKIILLALAGTVGAIAAPPAIGIITASGHFTLDRSEVWGNATLFDGQKVETTNASSAIALRNGVRVQLGGSSKADVSERRMILFQGVGQVFASNAYSASNAYEVDAGSLHVRPAGTDARVNVAYASNGTIEVAALQGEARVTLSGGTLLAAIMPGQKRSFALQNPAGRAVVHKGCLVTKEGRFEIQDQDTQEVVEVTGPPTLLNPGVGNRVTATGTGSEARPAITPATSVMNATAVSVDVRGGCLSVAAALNASAEPNPAAAATPGSPTPATPAGTTPKAGGGGLSTGAKIAIAAAVAGGGAGAAIALAGHKGSTSP